MYGAKRGIKEKRRLQKVIDLLRESMCGECDKELATTTCHDCSENYCDECSEAVHKRGRRKQHKHFSTIHICQRCSACHAQKQCLDCGLYLCGPCCDDVHSRGKARKHRYIKPVGTEQRTDLNVNNGFGTNVASLRLSRFEDSAGALPPHMEAMSVSEEAYAVMGKLLRERGEHYVDPNPVSVDIKLVSDNNLQHLSSMDLFNKSVEQQDEQVQQRQRRAAAFKTTNTHQSIHCWRRSFLVLIYPTLFGVGNSLREPPNTHTATTNAKNEPDELTEFIRYSPIFKRSMYDDSHFLLALAQVATSKPAFTNLFITCEYKDVGMYTFQFYRTSDMLEHGQEPGWDCTAVDDLFPCDEDMMPVFGRTKDENETWALLLEKAYAKFRGSYVYLHGGDHGSAMVHLTGGNTTTDGWDCSCITQQQINLIWWKLQCNYKNRCFTSAKRLYEPGQRDMWEKGFSSVSSSETDWSGDVGVAITQVAEINAMDFHEMTEYGFVDRYDSDFIQLVKLRNLYGNEDWNGDWSSTSDLWTPALRCELHSQQIDPSFTWMTLNDFLQHHQTILTTYNCLGSPWIYYGDLPIPDVGDEAPQAPQFMIYIDGCNGSHQYEFTIKISVPIDLNDYSKHDTNLNHHAKIGVVNNTSSSSDGGTSPTRMGTSGNSFRKATNKYPQQLSSLSPPHITNNNRGEYEGSTGSSSDQGSNSSTTEGHCNSSAPSIVLPPNESLDDEANEEHESDIPSSTHPTTTTDSNNSTLKSVMDNDDDRCRLPLDLSANCTVVTTHDHPPSTKPDIKGVSFSLNNNNKALRGTSNRVGHEDILRSQQRLGTNLSKYTNPYAPTYDQLYGVTKKSLADGLAVLDANHTGRARRRSLSSWASSLSFSNLSALKTWDKEAPKQNLILPKLWCTENVGLIPSSDDPTTWNNQKYKFNGPVSPAHSQGSWWGKDTAKDDMSNSSETGYRWTPDDDSEEVDITFNVNTPLYTEISADLSSGLHVLTLEAGQLLHQYLKQQNMQLWKQQDITKHGIKGIERFSGSIPLCVSVFCDGVEINDTVNTNSNIVIGYMGTNCNSKVEAVEQLIKSRTNQDTVTPLPVDTNDPIPFAFADLRFGSSEDSSALSPSSPIKHVGESKSGTTSSGNNTNAGGSGDSDGDNLNVMTTLTTTTTTTTTSSTTISSKFSVTSTKNNAVTTPTTTVTTHPPPPLESHSPPHTNNANNTTKVKQKPQGDNTDSKKAHGNPSPTSIVPHPPVSSAPGNGTLRHTNTSKSDNTARTADTLPTRKPHKIISSVNLESDVGAEVWKGNRHATGKSNIVQTPNLNLLQVDGEGSARNPGHTLQQLGHL